MEACEARLVFSGVFSSNHRSRTTATTPKHNRRPFITHSNTFLLPPYHHLTTPTRPRTTTTSTAAFRQDQNSSLPRFADTIKQLQQQEAIKSALMGIGVHVQATDQGELELDYIKSQVQKV